MVSILASPQSEPFMLLNNLSQDAMGTNSNKNCVDNNNTNTSITSSNVFHKSKSSVAISSLSDNSDNKLLQSVFTDSCRISESKQTQSATLKSKKSSSRVRQNSLGRRQSLTISKKRRSSMVQQGTETTNTLTTVDWVGSKQRTRIMSGLYGNNTNDMSIEDIMRERKTNAVLKNPVLFQMFQETLSHSVARYKPWGALNGFHTFLDEYIRIPELKEQIIERRKEENNRFQSASRLLSFLSTRTQTTSNDINETRNSGSDLFQRLTSRGQLLSSYTSKTGSRTSSETHSPTASDGANYDYMDDDDDAQSFNEDFTKGWRTSLSPEKSDTGTTSRSSDSGSDLFLPNLDSITIQSRHSRSNDDEYESDVVSCSDDSSEYDGVNDWSDN